MPRPQIRDDARVAAFVLGASRTRYLVMRQEDVWFITFNGEEFGPYRSEREAMLFATDAAHKLGELGEDTQVFRVDENGAAEPVWTYGRDYGSTVTGGFVYRGSRYAGELAGAYLGADFGSGRVFVGGAGGLDTVGHLDAITSFGEDDGHELWAVTYDGGLYELSAS